MSPTVFYTCMIAGTKPCLFTDKSLWLNWPCRVILVLVMWIFPAGFIILIFIISGAWAECQNDAPTLFFLVCNCVRRPVCSFVFLKKARLLRNIIETSLQSVTVYGNRIPTLSIYERRALVSRRARGESSDPLHLFPFRLLTATHKVMYHQQLENMLEMANGVAAISV